MAPRIRIKNFLLGSLPFAAIVVLWYFLSAHNKFFGIVFPPPGEFFREFAGLLWDGTLPKLFLVSLLNVFPAFILASLTATVLGTFIGINETARKIFSPLISALYLVPSLAWLPVLILIFGFSRETIWALVAVASFTKIIYTVIAGVRSINPLWWLTAKNFELSTFKTIVKIIIPGSLSHILGGLRTGFGSAWRSLVGAEMLVITVGGLGKYIWLSQWAFRFDHVLSGVLVIALVGIGAEVLIFERIERLTVEKWGMRQIGLAD